MRDQLTQARLKEVLEYDPETGLFRWRSYRCGRALAGAVCGTDNGRGYLTIHIDLVHYKAHRLAWLYVHGRWPTHLIDHINGVKGDNRIANLREADDAVNSQNQRRAQSHNKCGFLGVHKRESGRFRASIRVNWKLINIGTFDTPEAAHAAYVEAKRKLHTGGTL